MKPKSGFLELDVKLNPEYNFNKYQSLKWGDALGTARQAQNNNGTFGPASGFSSSGTKQSRGPRVNVKDKADRELQLNNDLATFYDARSSEKVMQTQTLGGQIINHNTAEESGKPVYFLGAFRKNQLHLTKVSGTVQMRPQFHHLDAEDQRTRLANSRASAADGEQRPDPPARGLTRTYKESKEQEQQEKEKPEVKMRKALQAAEEEGWVGLEYVDEEDQEAYDKFDEMMFVQDVDGAAQLKSGMDNEQFLDAISAPRHGSPTRRRKRPPRSKEVVDVEDQDEDEEMGGAEANGPGDGREAYEIPR